MAKGLFWHSATRLAGITLLALVTAVVGLSATTAEGPKLDPGFKAMVLTLLSGCFLVNIISIQCSVHERKAGECRLGHSKLTGADTHPNTSLHTASMKMCGVCGLLICTYSSMFYSSVPCYHMDPVRNRPINTLRCAEWSCAVPTLMWVLGHDLLKLPRHQVVVPIIHTLVHIWLTWAGQLVVWTWTRAFIISTSFTIFIEANIAQQRWHKHSHGLKSWALIFQVVLFALYSVVSLFTLANMVNPLMEDVLYTCLDIASKMGHTALIVLMGTTNEIDWPYHMMGSYLDVMADMQSLAAGQFDLLIYCQNSPRGLLIAGASTSLERCVGRDLVDQPLTEICFNQEDRRRLQKHRILRPPTSSIRQPRRAGEQEKDVALVEEMLRVDLRWAGSPTGSMPAELFTARVPTNAVPGDIVFIRVRLLKEEKGKSIPSAAEAQWADETPPGPLFMHLLASANHRKLFAGGNLGAVAAALQPLNAMATSTLAARIESEPQKAHASERNVSLATGRRKGSAHPAVRLVAGQPPSSAHNTHLTNPGPDWEGLVLSERELEPLQVLGHGSLGMVRKVRWRGGLYAQKLLENARWNPKQRGVWYKMRLEASILLGSATESHPNLCQLVKVVTSPQFSFIFELCTGGSMRSLLSTKQLVTWSQRLAILQQTASAVKHIHDFHIIHRDLKSDNILLLSPVTPETTPHVKVTDVGFTRWFEPNERSSSSTCGSTCCDGGSTCCSSGRGRIHAAARLAEDGGEGQHAASLGSAIPGMGALPVAPPASNSKRNSVTPGNLTIGSNSNCSYRAPELRAGIYGSAVDIYAFGVFLLELSAWMRSLPGKWSALLKTFPESRGGQQVARIAESCLAKEAARRSTAPEVLDTVQQLGVSDAEEFGILWLVHLTCARDDDT